MDNLREFPRGLLRQQASQARPGRGCATPASRDVRRIGSDRPLYGVFRSSLFACFEQWKIPENREINRECLEISHDSDLCGRFQEPVTKRVQWLAANSPFPRKQGNLFA